ncbi:alcohol dehydrogenase [Pseudoxanthobacter soli DSM 19599]|uniref:Alcohol dehydrogenase n=1 Tax=Pseudoxanthobacter soli DSM 19599 TaxID=1123029 RepID=A0A1M7Z9B2_9HYPH|nr:MDR family oxidoreductase [Pseudoxanthobacter soli]SHO61511.1 alcohol dehydrogenase [Pseudoxanthobacter soli DSM 19599]
MFEAILIENGPEGRRAGLTRLEEDALPPGDVTVAVSHSTLNYKDALAITGRGPVVRSYPMIPGIDFAGTVVDSASEAFRPGDRVVLNGWGLGESRWGGLGEKARVQGEWLVPLPAAFTPAQAMAIGTAGYTAMLAVLAIERHGVEPTSGDILVTGASGGVGSIAVALLSTLGFRVVASTGRPQEADFLTRLGAAEIVDRAQFSAPSKPLGSQRWAAAIDSVGSHTLANVCATMCYRGIVAACGLAQGMDFPATVAPFILRGVTLAGIDSVYRPQADRIEAWSRLARDLDPAKLALITREIALAEAVAAADDLLAGRLRGRCVVRIAS